MSVSILYPRFRLNLLPAMLGFALLGAMIAGVYGVVHDQITYSISPEYFTRLKFPQFHYADFGLPARFFVAEIGFLATWWVAYDDSRVAQIRRGQTTGSQLVDWFGPAQSRQVGPDGRAQLAWSFGKQSDGVPGRSGELQANLAPDDTVDAYSARRGR